MSQCLHKMDFCFWAKLLIAIPTLPLVAILAAGLFEDGTNQSLAAVIAVIGVVLLARWIDRIPALQKKIIEKK